MATVAQITEFKSRLPEFALYDDWSATETYTHPISVWGSGGYRYDSIEAGTLSNDPVSSSSDWSKADLNKAEHDGNISRAYDLALEIYRLKEIGTIYCAAHIYVVQDLGEMPPKISEETQAVWNKNLISEQIGDHRVTYTHQTSSTGSNAAKHRAEEFTSDFSRTKYGRMFIHIYDASVAMSVRVF